MAKKVSKKSKKKVEEENEGGTSLDDAFEDDEDVEYAESKPRKVKKMKKGEEREDDNDEELEEEVGDAEELMSGMDDKEESHHQVKASKPISKVKKGDKVTIDGRQFEVDSHYCLIDHGSTKEMAIELFDSKSDKDYQLRYFDDQVNETLEFYELQEILYVKKHFVKVSW